jgi:ArsR family transcriptional regulator, arsenate/arsenite/antimonite-responsive transcriptional repressor
VKDAASARAYECAPGCACAPGGAAAPQLIAALADDRMDAALKALASSPRRHLLRIIAASTSADGSCCEPDVCACKLADALELAPSTISHHMSVLVKAGLVTATKRGLWVYYRLERDALAAVASTLATL